MILAVITLDGEVLSVIVGVICAIIGWALSQIFSSTNKRIAALSSDVEDLKSTVVKNDKEINKTIKDEIALVVSKIENNHKEVNADIKAINKEVGDLNTTVAFFSGSMEKEKP